MKTIAITIDEPTLERMDRLVDRGSKRFGNRSAIVRQAVSEYVAHHERTAEEERERDVFRRHRKLLERQAVALVEEQGKP